MAGETSPDPNAPCPAEARSASDADLLRLLGLLVVAVDCAGPDGLRLTNGSALVALARTVIDGSARDPQATRSALMALRDLVWRVDVARSLIEPWLDEQRRGDLAALLDTDDIHAFLRREP